MSHASGVNQDNTQLKPRLGISSCLLGHNVRYDGGHKHNPHITAALGQVFEFVPFCPEVAIGLGTPRAPIRLLYRSSGIRAENIDNPDMDVGDALRDYAEAVLPEISNLSGCIVKKGSPSCGKEKVQILRNAIPCHDGRGIFTARLMQLLPGLPIEEEGRLMDQRLREDFIARVLSYHHQLS